MSAVRAVLQVAGLMAVPCTLLLFCLWLLLGIPS